MAPKKGPKKPGKRAKTNRPHSSQRGTNQAADADADADADAMEEVEGEEEGEEAEGEGKSYSKLVNHQLSALPSFFVVPFSYLEQH
jgi:hypothetical protein